MKRTTPLLFGALAALLLPAAPALLAVGRAQIGDTGADGRPHAVLAADREGTAWAYLPGVPEMVAAARAEVIPHPTGRYALIVRREETPAPGPALGEPHTGGTSLLLYDGVTNRTRVLWEAAALKGTRRAEVVSAHWLPDSDTVVAEVSVAALDAPTPEAREPLTHLLAADVARDARARTLLTAGPHGFPRIGFGLAVSPSRPLAAVNEVTPEERPYDQQTTPLRFLDARGRLGPVVSVRGFGVVIGWSEDGASAILWQVPPRPSTPEGPRGPNRYVSVDAATGAVTELTPDVRPKRGKRRGPLAPPLRAVVGAGRVTPPADGAAAVPLRSLWLVAAAAPPPKTAGDASPVLLAPHADEAWTLPDGSAVLYRARGVVCAVPITRIPRARYETALLAALKEKALRDAKQIALALLGYCQDYDEVFPPTDKLSAVGPYLKDSSLVQGRDASRFAYALNGDRLAGIGKPAETALGYLPGPGGRAVVYADGAVRWEETPPPR